MTSDSSMPTVSIIMPILNEEFNLERALTAISKQTFPLERIELLISDGGSTDQSISVINKYIGSLNIKLIDNSKLVEAEWGKGLAFKISTGKYVLTMDADVWPSSELLIESMVDVFENDFTISGVFARYLPCDEMSLWSKFLSYDPLQEDPLLQALKKPLINYVIKTHQQYNVLSFKENDVPPIGQTTMLRRDDISLESWGGRWSEIDQIALFVQNGKSEYASMKTVGFHHDHCRTLKDLSIKRKRNVVGLKHGYLSNYGSRQFVWIDMNDSAALRRLLMHVILANLILPAVFLGIRDAIKFKSIVLLVRPVVDVVVTDTLVLTFLCSREGRAWISKFLKNLF